MAGKAADDQAWPASEGEMARLVREHDWAATPLGPVATWPQSLRTAVDTILGMPGPAVIHWGPQHVQVYNDAFIAIARGRHPRLLGQPAATGWADVFDEVLVLLSAVLGGQAVQLRDSLSEVDGPAGPEPRVFDTDWSPLRDEGGEVAGVLQTLVEVKERRRAEAALRESQERQAFLLRLSDALRPLADPAEIEGKAVRLLGEHLAVDNAHYVRIDGAVGRAHVAQDYVRGERPSLTGDYALSDFDWVVPLSRTGRPTAIADARTSPLLPDGQRAAMAAIRVVGIAVAPLVKDDAWVGALVVTQLEPRQWTASEVRLLEETGERIWAAAERARAEASQRASEASYRTLLEAIDEGMALCEMIPTGEGRLADFRYLEVNPAFEAITGMPAAATVGRRVREVLPPPYDDWVDTYAEVVRTGEPQRFERWLAPLGRWLSVYAFPQDGLRFGVLFSDVTGRRRAEERLRESEARQAYLLKLADALRPLADPVEIQETACRVLGEHTGANRVLYGEVVDERTVFIRRNYVDGLFPLEVTLDAEEFGRDLIAAYKQREKVIFSDVRTDPRLGDDERRSYRGIGLVANASLGLVKGGRWVAAMGLHQASPREWTPLEVLLLEDTAERTWAAVERARAEAGLRERDEQLQAFGEASSDVLWIRDADTLDWTYLSPAFEAIYGMGRDEALRGDSFRNWLDLVAPEDRERARAMIGRVLAGERVTFEYRITRPVDGALRTMRNTDFPIRDAGGRVTRIAGVGHDATAEVEVEAALAASEESASGSRSMWVASPRGTGTSKRTPCPGTTRTTACRATMWARSSRPSGPGARGCIPTTSRPRWPRSTTRASIGRSTPASSATSCPTARRGGSRRAGGSSTTRPAGPFA